MKEASKDIDLKRVAKLASKHYENLPYHNFKHALRVKDNALMFIERCKKYDVNVDKEILIIAALFHDAGYSEVKTNKEAHSAKIAEKELRKIKYPQSRITWVKETIMATKQEGPLKTVEQKIIRAADLLSFTTSYKQFLDSSKKIQKEYKLLYGKADFPIEGWTKLVKSYLKPRIRITPEFRKDDFHSKAEKNIDRFLKDFKKTQRAKNRLWILRFRAKDRVNFLEIKCGKKTIETRAATDKYREIIKGDVLVFTCGKEKLEKKIKKVEIFKSLNAMFRAVNPKHIMPSVPTTSEMKKIYYGYPGYKEKLKEVGVIAFWI